MKKNPPFVSNLIHRMRNYDAERILRTSSLSSISDLSDKDLDKIRDILEQGMIDGQNPLTLGLELAGRINPVTKERTGGIIRLSNHQIEEKNKIFAWLKALDGRYLSVEIRDKRYDRTFQKAMDKRLPLSQEQIERIMIAYENRALKQRADIIARTEMLKSINQAAYIAHLQAINEGMISMNQLSKEWDSCGDEHVRSSHVVMEEKYGRGKGIRIDEPFILPSGAKLLYPGDISLGAPLEEVEGCRCRVRYEVDWLSSVE